MVILNPEHLLEQAERLIEPPAAGPPRQVDVRRAVAIAMWLDTLIDGAVFREWITNLGRRDASARTAHGL